MLKFTVSFQKPSCMLSIFQFVKGQTRMQALFSQNLQILLLGRATFRDLNPDAKVTRQSKYQFKHKRCKNSLNL